MKLISIPTLQDNGRYKEEASLYLIIASKKED